VKIPADQAEVLQMVDLSDLWCQATVTGCS
jgi:hypothetical protein